jgi:hypothetical protein
MLQRQIVGLIPRQLSNTSLTSMKAHHYSYSVQACPVVEVTVVAKQTILRPGSTTTELKTSVLKSGIIVTTIGTSPNVVPRNYPHSSEGREKPSWPWEQPPWKPIGPCSASTVTKTVVEYTTSVLSGSAISDTTVLVEPGICARFSCLASGHV